MIQITDLSETLTTSSSLEVGHETQCYGGGGGGGGGVGGGVGVGGVIGGGSMEFASASLICYCCTTIC